MTPRLRSRRSPGRGSGSRTPAIGVVAIAVVLVFPLPIAAPAVAAPTDGGGVLVGCGTVDAPGRYVLVANVTHRTDGACIAVTASNVTLDGAGHVLDAGGDRAGTVGIRVGAADGPSPGNVTVANLTVAGFGDGVLARGPVTVANVSARDLADDGLAVTADRGSVRVTDLAVASVGGNGLAVTGGADLAARRVRVTDAGADGLRAEVSGDVSATAVTVADTGRYGVYVEAGGRAATFERVRIRGSTWEGLEVLGTANVTVRDLRVSAVRGGDVPEPYDAVFVDVGGSVTLGNATVRDVSTGRGAYVYAATGNGAVAVRNATVEDVGGDALVLGSYGETALRVADAAVRNASGRALVVSGASTTVSNLSVAPVRVDGSPVEPARLGGTGQDFAVAAAGVDPPGGRAVVGGPVAVSVAGGRFEAALGYDPPGDSTAGLYRRGADEWSRVPAATLDPDAGTASVRLDDDAVLAVLADDPDPLAPYTDERGVVDDAGLTRAVEDWVRGRLSDDALRRAIRSWVRDRPVEGSE